MTTIYGIKNCDTVKKARRWLQDQDIAYDFFDVREDGLSAEQLQRWNQQCGWLTLLNKRSTTWKNLSTDDRDNINEDKALALMLASPTLIKRPVLEHGDKITVGFKAENYATLFK